MKLVTYESAHQLRPGVVEGQLIVDVRKTLELLSTRHLPRVLAARPTFKAAARVLASAGFGPRSMIELLAQDAAWRQALGVVTASLARAYDPRGGMKGLFSPLQKARLRPPILRPGKIICVGRNYAEHARERGAEVPARPIYFLKSNNTICGPGDPIRVPSNSKQVDYEAELAVVMGKGGKQIPEEKAYEYIAGYMILNDISARDMQAADKQWFRGKSCDTFAPIGPWIVTSEEIPDPHALHISLTLNGQTMQDSSTGDMIFKIPYLLSYLSQSLTFEPGDILSTGTPEGIGAGRTPPVFLKPGDSVSVTIEKIGTLTNPVA
jgi:2-keto-4-pentenoate hydratase/2-oxohepta-3-ene-1,7-dioic acid hydratase in catechol pathway